MASNSDRVMRVTVQVIRRNSHLFIEHVLDNDTLLQLYSKACMYHMGRLAYYIKQVLMKRGIEPKVNK